MLSFAEEILLLLLEDEDGRMIHVPELSMRCVLAGAVLMELALADKIDTDLEKLVVLNTDRTGDEMMDLALERISATDREEAARYWVEHLARDAETFRTMALDRLVEKNILNRVDDRLFWVFKTRRYPMVDGSAEREVKLRIMDILFRDTIPEPRDIVIICLVDACNIFKHLLTERDHKLAAERIQQCRRMDLIGQAVGKSVRDIEASLALALHPPF